MGRDYYGLTFDDYVTKTGLAADLADLDLQIASAQAGADTNLLQELQARRAEWISEARIAHAKATDYRTRRAAEYPVITDQLDALLKQMVKLQQAGIALDADMDAIVKKWQGVKIKYPKPVKE